MSKPIITTYNVGCKEVVADGINGYLIPVKDTESLVVACEKLINLSKDQLAKMGEASREIAVTKFDEKKVLGAYISLIGELNIVNNSVTNDQYSLPV
jgi:glycosyltransferase involved in cell wall biosynthesis